MADVRGHELADLNVLAEREREAGDACSRYDTIRYLLPTFVSIKRARNRVWLT
jgi:hypothetical protein